MLKYFISALLLSLSIPAQCYHLNSFEDHNETTSILQERTDLADRKWSKPWPDRKMPYCFYIPPNLIPTENGKIPDNWKEKERNLKKYIFQAVEKWQRPESAGTKYPPEKQKTEEDIFDVVYDNLDDQQDPEPLGEYNCPVLFEHKGDCPRGDERNQMLVITLTTGKEVYTSLGYHEKEPNPKNDPNKERDPNQMEVGVDFLGESEHNQIGRYAHELGRAAGLPNENQLYPKWFNVNCKNIKGYASKTNKHADTVWQAACKSFETAESIQWKEGMQFAPLEAYQNPVTQEPDPNSIMMLGSRTFGQAPLMSMGQWDVLVAKDGDDKSSVVTSESRKVTDDVDWYKGPSLVDLVALFQLYEQTDDLLKFAGNNCVFLSDFVFGALPPYDTPNN